MEKEVLHRSKIFLVDYPMIREAMEVLKKGESATVTWMEDCLGHSYYRVEYTKSHKESIHFPGVAVEFRKDRSKA
jgi:hypothetical protein